MYKSKLTKSVVRVFRLLLVQHGEQDLIAHDVEIPGEHCSRIVAVYGDVVSLATAQTHRVVQAVLVLGARTLQVGLVEIFRHDTAFQDVCLQNRWHFFVLTNDTLECWRWLVKYTHV